MHNTKYFLDTYRVTENSDTVCVEIASDSTGLMTHSYKTSTSVTSLRLLPVF